MQAQTYPALHVTVRSPFALTPANKAGYSARRSMLDQRVKKVLLNTPSQFTEWLIQTRLVRAVQYCPVHPVTFDGQPRQLRLGMFTDSDKLIQSGGYVWVKNCCRPKFLSVHYGSLFDANRLSGTNTLPVQVLKLMYHWSCQTPLHNVIQWLKVRPALVDEVYGLLRAVCMLKTEEPAGQLGGGGRVVQVGLVSLGTSGPDGLNKNVKVEVQCPFSPLAPVSPQVEVLGVKDETTGEIRMVGFEPRIKNRIRAVVSAVQDWVQAESSLLLDHSISPQPFRAHFQEVANAPPASKDISGNIMHYLRRSMPRMFQASLVFLNPAVICQFIAEIAWRERYGRDPNSTFSNLINHLGSLTQQCEGPLITMLRKVLVSPSMDLKRKPRKQKLATRPDSQPEFPGQPPEPSASSPAVREGSGARSATDSPAPTADQVRRSATSPAPGETERNQQTADQTASDGAGSESGASSSAGGGASSRRRRAGGPSGSSRKPRRRRPQPQQQQPVIDDTRGCFYKLETLSDVKLPDLSEFRCWECKLPLTHPKHITGVYACKRCRYTTSCEKIYPVHQRVFHSKGVAPVFTMGQPVQLEAAMYCPCGFSTDSGNRLALHLSSCEQRTASLVPFDANLSHSSGAGDGDADAEIPMDVDAELKLEPTETVDL
ncbi:hypothetical protein FJT64_022450 [Amphibalanus amphitrite]|uniref:POGZ/Z280C-D-like double Zinc finger domain-containing protein n=1 Tax=Amphibalanus amphitrite TaxID=1232801 RepID=A0A6A4WH39_AMPAM|nr:hypothetical protein FJT64_022450 [Amphibalanus amphitrite]